MLCSATPTRRPTSSSKPAIRTGSGAEPRAKLPIGSRRQNIKSIAVIAQSTLVILFVVAGVAVSSSELPQPQQQLQQQQQPATRWAAASPRGPRQLDDGQDDNGFQLHDLYSMHLDQQQQQDHRNNGQATMNGSINPSRGGAGPQPAANGTNAPHHQQGPRNASSPLECPNGLLTFELSTGFIYKPATADDTLSMMPSTLQLTDCLDYCLHNSSCLAINFEMGLCVLLAASAKQNQHNLYLSQFPVFTIYAEKKCLLQGK
jgi:hypothetical protein